MIKLPEGPSSGQVQRDRIDTAIGVLDRMLRFKRRALGAPFPAGWDAKECEAYKHQTRCEIEALETAIAALHEDIVIDQIVEGMGVPTLGENTC